MNFTAALYYLLALGHETLAIKLGLKNTELLLAGLGNPERAYHSVQIAGTNGKGSTAVVLDSICRQAGIKTGLYTSPHLVSITERIRFNGCAIGETEFGRLAGIVRTTAEELLAKSKIEALPTFFEQVTAIALLAFREAKVDLAILETGLGGRLDSTTAANAQVVAITQIALDHEEYLGHTIASIAAEKAAIIKPGVHRVIVAPNQPPEALAIIKKRCDEFDIIPIDACTREIEDVSADGRFCVTFSTPTSTYERLWLGLRGKHQIDNVAVAIQLAESVKQLGWADIPTPAICAGVTEANNPGRLEIVSTSPTILLDGAHNPAGAKALREYLEAFAKRPLTLIFGAMRDKQLETIAETLLPVADHVILSPVNSPRATPVAQLQQIAERHLPPRQITISSCSSAALETAIALTSAAGMICVAGSLYLIGEIRPQLVTVPRA